MGLTPDNRITRIKLSFYGSGAKDVIWRKKSSWAAGSVNKASESLHGSWHFVLQVLLISVSLCPSCHSFSAFVRKFSLFQFFTIYVQIRSPNAIAMHVWPDFYLQEIWNIIPSSSMQFLPLEECALNTHTSDFIAEHVLLNVIYEFGCCVNCRSLKRNLIILDAVCHVPTC